MVDAMSDYELEAHIHEYKVLTDLAAKAMTSYSVTGNFLQMSKRQRDQHASYMRRQDKTKYPSHTVTLGPTGQIKQPSYPSSARPARIQKATGLNSDDLGRIMDMMLKASQQNQAKQNEANQTQTQTTKDTKPNNATS
jgi:hypothetical protein